MNRFWTAVVLVTTLIFLQSCTNSPSSQKASLTASHDSAEPAPSGSHSEDHSDAHGSNAHDGEVPSRSPLASLRAEALETDQPAALAIHVQDAEGRPVEQFDTFQEQLMHLILVSDDLQHFRHLHPAYTGKGHFEVETRFPQGGSYTLFSDYKPTGQAETVSVLKAQVKGDRPPAPTPDWTRTQSLENAVVNLSFSEESLQAGEDVTIKFELQDPRSQEPLSDLQPYLGEAGHLVIVQAAETLTRDHYIHAHALPDAPTGQVRFATQFPEPGRYRLWGQFQRDGQVITAGFWVNVAP